MNTIESIIEDLKEGKSIKKVAREKGFNNKAALGEFMLREGYCWDSRERTYIKKQSEFLEYKEYRNPYTTIQNELDKLMEMINTLHIDEDRPTLSLHVDEVIYNRLLIISKEEGLGIEEMTLRLIEESLNKYKGLP